MAELYSSLCDIALDRIELVLPKLDDPDKLEDILSKRDISRSKKAENIATLLGIAELKIKKNMT